MPQRSVILLMIALSCLRLTGLHAQTVKDIDDNLYSSVTIGNQIWMAENLKTTKYNDGTPIPLVTDDKKWKGLKTPAYCWFNNDIENKDVYGALYNWYTVNTKKLCPNGWHVPTDSEWNVMITSLGDVNLAGNKLKEAGSAHWKNTLSYATNESGFTALPGGMRYDSGAFPLFGNSYAVWWTTTEYSATQAWNHGLYFTSSFAYRGYDYKPSGFSVRCLKD